MSGIPNVPDIIRMIFLELDYPDILSLCATSKQFYQYYNSSLLWSQKAEKDFDFPRQWFNLGKSMTPIKRYEKIWDYIYNPNEYLIKAAREGDLDLVKWLVDHGATFLNHAMLAAEAYGHRLVANWLLEYRKSIRYAVSTT